MSLHLTMCPAGLAPCAYGLSLGARCPNFVTLSNRADSDEGRGFRENDVDERQNLERNQAVIEVIVWIEADLDTGAE